MSARESKEEEEKQKRIKRAELKQLNNAPCAPSKSLDSSLKRHSGLIKRLRQSLGADNRDQVLKDIEGLTLEKYVEEIVQASIDGMSRCKTEKDIWAAAEIVSAFHRRFPEAYTPPLVAMLAKELAAPSRAALNALSADQREKEESARIVRQRPLLRISSELALVGVLVDGPGRSGGDWIMKVVRELLVNDPTLGSLPLFTTFLKGYSRPFLGITPSSSPSKQVASDVQAGDLASTVAQDAANGTSNGATLSNEKEELIEKDIRDKFKRMCEGYYENVAKKLLKEHNRLQDQDRRNHEAYIKSGEIFEDRQQAYEKMTKSYEKLLSSCQSLSDLLYLPMPSLPSASQKNDSILLLDGSSSLRLGGTEDLPANSKWEDEEERRFYEDLPDLKEFVPKAVLGVEAVASKEERDALAKEKVADAETGKTQEEQEKQDVARLEAEMENMEVEELKVEADQVEDQPPSRSPSPTQGPATGASQVLTALLARLSDANNRTMIDEVAVEFAFLNSKASRKRLVKFLSQPPKNRTDILPYFARLVAILNPYMPDVGTELVSLLEDEFRYLQKKKKVVKEMASNRMKNTLYLSALAKFRVVPAHLILHVFKVYLDDLNGVNVDNAAMLLEGCGRFLLRTEETGPRMATMLELMRRKQSMQHFDQRQVLMLENAYYQCNPPERVPRVEKTRSTMEMFIRHLIYDVLAKKTIDKVLKLLRKLDWNDPSIYAALLRVFTKPWKVKYSNVSFLAMLAYDLQRHHPEFSIRVVDQVLEEIRLGMEQNIYKNNQRRVATAKYLGELYMYRLINSTLIFDTLWSLVTFGHPDGRPLPGQVSPIDAPDDFFRIRLVCVLLDSCGMCFDQGSQKKKLDNFLTFLQLYMHCKQPMPMEVDFMLNDTFEALRPKLTLLKSFEEAAIAVDAMFDLSANDAAGDGDESDHGGDDSGDEKDGDRRKGQKDDGSDMDISDDGARPTSPEAALLLMSHSENTGPSEEAEAEFAKELAKMFIEAPGDNRRVDRKAIWEGPSLPTGVRKKREEEDSGVDQNPGIVKFTVASRKGNKVQTRQLPVPVETELVKQTRQSQMQDKAEQQQLKRIVLDYEQREDAEEQRAFEETMRDRGFKIKFT